MKFKVIFITLLSLLHLSTTLAQLNLDNEPAGDPNGGGNTPNDGGLAPNGGGNTPVPGGFVASKKVKYYRNQNEGSLIAIIRTPVSYLSNPVLLSDFLKQRTGYTGDFLIEEVNE